MNITTKQFKAFRIGTQLFLFVLPIILSFLYVPYKISYDKMYIESVNERALELGYKHGDELTDFSETVIARNDAQGTYLKKEWRQQNQEVYYIWAIVFGIFIGMGLQLLNGFWYCFYDDNKYEFKDIIEEKERERKEEEEDC